MAAEFYTPAFRAPNAERADGEWRLWGGYSMPAKERARQERLGIIAPRRTVAVGRIADPASAAFRGALVVVDEEESTYVL